MMKKFGLVLILLAGLMACAPLTAPEAEVTPVVITVVVPPSETPTPDAPAVPSDTPPPADTPAPPPPTATTGPQCTVLQRLNFRKGPGTAFNPPIDVLDKAAVVTPVGFSANGFPSGSWVQAVDAAGRTGWVSAGTQFISCNVDVNSLPAVAVEPPPAPRPPSVSNSQPQGTFDGFEYELIFSSRSLLRIALRATGTSNDGDGVKQVKFIVQDKDGNPVYEKTEGKAAFCIFGGDDPSCNPWPVNQYQLTWGEGGPAAVNGTYKVRIEAEGVDEFGSDIFGNWRFEVTLGPL
jgi:hypothetical protein